MASEQVVSYVLRYGGNCRDCADADGICPNTDMPCGFELKTVVIKHTLTALEYGISHGYIADPFTRPAPSATDTGLETVGFQCSSNAVEWCETLIPKVREQHGYKIREVVTRSQAEELLAAEHDVKMFHVNDAVKAWNEVSRLETRVDALEADNAAQAARIKRLELDNAKLEERLSEEQESHSRTGASRDKWREKVEALEAKIAAAQKVREAAIELDEAISDDFNIFGAQQKLRAVLGGKPS